jgi:hypothetical protein
VRPTAGALLFEVTSAIMQHASKEKSGTAPAVISQNQFCDQVGISPVTAWRWRRLGWITTVNIAGRQYILSEEIERFKRRAATGEFSKQHRTPMRPALIAHAA